MKDKLFTQDAIFDQGSGLGIYLSGKVLVYYVMGPRCNF